MRAFTHIRTMRTSTNVFVWHARGWELLMGPLRRWWVPSMALTACVALAGWWGIGAASEGLSNWLMVSWGGNAFAQKTLEWVIWAMLLVIKVKVTKYVVLVFMGPLFAEVSASAGAALGEPTKAFSWRQWLHEVVRGARAALLMAVLELTILVACWVLGLLVPVLSPVTLPLAWLVGAWVYGASAMDYVWERNGMGARAGLRASLARPWMALGLGVPFALWMSVPVLAWTVGPMMGGMLASASAAVALNGASDHQAVTV